MSVKDPFQQLVDEITLIRQDMERLKRTSLDKEEAEALHEILALSVDRMRKVGPEVQAAIDKRLAAVAAGIQRDATRAAASAAEGAIAKSHDASLDAARSLSKAAGEARREAWRYFGGFWVWLLSMLATGAVLGVLLAYGTETAKSFFSVEQMVRYSCGFSWFGGQVVDQDDGSSFCAFWITPAPQSEN
jgi:CHASE3 domain sensor protein